MARIGEVFVFVFLIHCYLIYSFSKITPVVHCASQEASATNQIDATQSSPTSDPSISPSSAGIANDDLSVQTNQQKSSVDGSAEDIAAKSEGIKGEDNPESTRNQDASSASTSSESIESATTAEPSTNPTTTTPSTTTTERPTSTQTFECPDNNYCLNGGTCILNESGAPICICPPEFYGTFCQTRNICKTLIVDSLTGDQICEKIGRLCMVDDRFFRCSCQDDEYFIFKPNQSKNQSVPNNKNRSHGDTVTKPPSLVDFIVSPQASTFSYENYYTVDSDPGRRAKDGSSYLEPEEVKTEPAYMAECRKIDSCLGRRCRQISEFCLEGLCVCNNKLGFVRDPNDGLCKLLNPCLLPTPDGAPICGQAKCVATLDEELYKCICPVGYRVVKVNENKSSTQCVLLTDAICEIPLLNKCQQICQTDQQNNNYKCSCLPGYKSGSKPGVDDHMCFFDENVDRHNYLESVRDTDSYDEFGYSEIHGGETSASTSSNNDFVFETHPRRKISHSIDQQAPADKEAVIPYDNSEPDKVTKTSVNEIYDIDGTEFDHIPRHPRHFGKGGDDTKIEIKRVPRVRDPTGRRGDSDDYGSVDTSKMSAQERCNMYCEENKICVLESGSTDSYRCVCDRQGYVSVGDRCLDWCAAAEFNDKVRGQLEVVCYSGVCKPSSLKPGTSGEALSNRELAELERKSSWRPSFECDCSSSPLINQDPETGLCKLDFDAVIKPCLPGNEGYIDCVENKNAYCSVLYQPNYAFIRNLQRDRQGDSESGMSPNFMDHLAGLGKAKLKPPDKSYICVCSPEKKFLVDKPRNKARCVDECDLLNNECGRFNRMCRTATIELDDFGHKNLVRLDQDGPRMNFKRTGCECLPGFNVGPKESVDVTLDDNNPFETTNPTKDPNYSTILDAINHRDPLADLEHKGIKYININSRCLLDYDVVEFHASFKAPADFDPRWVKIKNMTPLIITKLQNHKNSPVPSQQNPEASQKNEIQEGESKDLSKQKSTKEGKGKDSRDDWREDEDHILRAPEFMKADISDLHKSIVFVAQCDPYLAHLSLEAYQQCVIYRYWIVRKLRNHFVDWKRVMTAHLKETFDLMEGNIKLRVNKCEATIKSISVPHKAAEGSSAEPAEQRYSSPSKFDPLDPHAIVDADIDCELTLHSASDESSPRYSRKVLLEKQLQKFIFNKPKELFGDGYYLMAPRMLIKRESFDHLAEHRKLFSPCQSDFAYCDKQTKCEMVDTVNFTCTCEYGYTPIGSRDLYLGDSRKEVCEDINECLFDVCKELENVSTCINEIGDYRCQCNRHYTGDNKRFCTHVCNTIPCKHGKCRLVDDHHAFCECEDGYKEADCSVQDPSVALRKANMIICGSIFASVLLLAITLAISLSSQLKKTKRKLKRLEAANEAANLFDNQPFRPRMSKVSVCS